MQHMTIARRDELVEAVFDVVQDRTAGPHAAMPPHSAGCCYGVGLYDAAVAAVGAVLADLEIDVVDGPSGFICGNGFPDLTDLTGLGGPIVPTAEQREAFRQLDGPVLP